MLRRPQRTEAVQRAQPAAHLVPRRGGWGQSKEPKA